jgi:hypothetical protein
MGVTFETNEPRINVIELASSEAMFSLLCREQPHLQAYCIHLKQQTPETTSFTSLLQTPETTKSSTAHLSKPSTH